MSRPAGPQPYCYATGERRWCYEFAEGTYIPAMLPAAAGNGTVVTAARNLHSVDAGTGEPDAPIQGPPSVVNNDLLIAEHS